MCLVALALGQSLRFPLVLASNRDEFHDRRTAGLDWWTPDGADQPLLAGRDLQAGGTWFGLTARGRLALVTNVRSPAPAIAAAPSRGGLVPGWLLGAEDGFDAFWESVQSTCHNGFNLIAADASRGAWTWASNRAPSPRTLQAGVHGLSNASLDTAWPKTERLKQRLRDALAAANGEAALDRLADALFDALTDRRIAPDAQLPSTGLALDRERELSSAFIRTTDGLYGTRCSTLLIVERRDERGAIAHVFERRFDRAAQAVALRRTRLFDWPAAPGATARVEPVTEEAASAQAGAERRP